jgi:hypothetical protein|eukprot:7386370-Prymnesium_polylepis.5
MLAQRSLALADGQRANVVGAWQYPHVVVADESPRLDQMVAEHEVECLIRRLVQVAVDVDLTACVGSREADTRRRVV